MTQSFKPRRPARTMYATCPTAEETGRPCPECSADGTARRAREANAQKTEAVR